MQQGIVHVPPSIENNSSHNVDASVSVLGALISWSSYRQVSSLISAAKPYPLVDM